MLSLSISARGLLPSILGKLWPLPRIRREASTWTPSSFDPPRQICAYYLMTKATGTLDDTSTSSEEGGEILEKVIR